MKKFIALVPMKAQSERVKNKNIRDLAGKPLFYYILSTLKKCKDISAIYVNTDSDKIIEFINQDFKGINIIRRPQHLVGHDIPMNDIIQYDLSQIKGDYFLQTHSTNPLLSAETIEKAIEAFWAHPKCDSLFSVTKMLKRYYDSKRRPINHDRKKLLNTQDLEAIYEENSCIYLFSKKSFEVNGNRLGSNPYMFETNKSEAIDIDDEYDFEMVKKIIK